MNVNRQSPKNVRRASIAFRRPEQRAAAASASAEPSAKSVDPSLVRARHGATLLELVVRRVADIGEPETRGLRMLPYCDEVFDAGSVICDSVTSGDRISLLIAGTTASVTRHGAGEPIGTGLSVPGDFLDLDRLVMPALDYSVVAQDRCLVRRYDICAKLSLLHEHDACLRAVWRLSLAEARRYRTWITARATLRTEARIAHLLCELHERLKAVGLACDGQFKMPISQKDVGTLLGYSRAQTNRNVQCLRSRGLVSWEAGQVVIREPVKLAELARFDAGQI
ncbi:Crp/Fnr family transcriptional regulator (plasmid) [Roseivivax marinus]|uniref:Crp/Fnr family transcriptional regulator n=1 Tax=Roseivivax marinus TaxID=1379903 RepID=UPI001F041625|nr:Crp/Fnr family transcriptional regulator [Roseivivax marinus]UMA67127.1 Crp/Fnr family transcriptional regulator [Roseivivax marinus]